MLGCKDAMDNLHVRVVENLLRKGADPKALTTEVGLLGMLCMCAMLCYTLQAVELAFGDRSMYWLSHCRQPPRSQIGCIPVIHYSACWCLTATTTASPSNSYVFDYTGQFALTLLLATTFR